VLFTPVPFVVVAFVLAGFRRLVVGGGAVRGGGICAAGVRRLSLVVVPFAPLLLVLAAFVLVLFAFVLVLLRWRRSFLLSLWPIYRIVVVSNHFLCTLVLTCWAHAPVLQLGIDI
jgi:hypothetical protein